MKFGLIIIGDEILSGKRADKHMVKVIELLKARVTDARLEEFRWLLEELRVSLFAQELKTPMPVSVKRLQKAWDAWRNL